MVELRSIVDPTLVAVDALLAQEHPHLAPRDGV
ncbi:predicted protein [Streptomyces filamentosus NRRL 15998]|uniref:Predicted protein n=1 Tax=Streptomyces filamentosus NRRL 15998 TaxID=457431 RepID=D6AKX0_STRFL|nr:predicted protein [Streptomyces filamentosus NRRL 15998]